MSNVGQFIVVSENLEELTRSSDFGVLEVLKQYPLNIVLIKTVSEIDDINPAQDDVILIPCFDVELLEKRIRSIQKTIHGFKIILKADKRKIGELCSAFASEVIEVKNFNHISFGYVLELITRRLELGVKLRNSNKELKRLYLANSEGMIKCDARGALIKANHRMLDILGYETMAQMREMEPNFFMASGVDIAWMASHMENHGLRELSVDEAVLKSRNGGSVTVRVQSLLIDAEGQKAIHFKISDWTPMQQMQSKFMKGISHDFLTELPNRFEFMDILAEHQIEAENKPGLLGVILIDLDDFKMVNDGFGHDAGDSVIVETAFRLKAVLQNAVAICRMGSDEFAALYTGLDSGESLSWEVDRINEAFLTPFEYADKELRLTVSLGILLVEDNSSSPEEIMRMADTALHKAKKKGGGNIVVYDDQMRKESERRINLVIDIERGLRESEFEVYYQPIVSLLDKQIEGFEALIRWNHPTKGMIPPIEFIGLAEETNLILPMGRWILQEVCAQTVKWLAKGYGPLYASVNASPNQFLKSNLVEDVFTTLKSCGLKPENLKIEVTESLAVRNVEFGKMVLEQLRDGGVQLSIDDFGTGYSALAYLRKFPFSNLKIDRAFVMEVTKSKEDIEIVKAIIALAKGLGLKTIAEGVESVDERAVLTALGCDAYQGYLFSRPLPAIEFEKLLKKDQ